MQLSKKEINPQLEQGIRETFFQVLSDMNSPEDIRHFLQDLLTDAEVIAFAKRLAIAKELNEGKSYDAIRTNLKVSSATIASVQDRLGKDSGLHVALEKIQAEQWANVWVDKILSFVGSKQASSSS